MERGGWRATVHGVTKTQTNWATNTFTFPFYMWVMHRSLLLRLPWRTWVCPSEDWVWRWRSCLDQRPWKHQVCGGAGAEDTALLGLFLASGNSAPVRTRYGGGSAGCIVGNLAMPGVQGSWWLWVHEIFMLLVFFFFFPSLWQLYPSED